VPRRVDQTQARSSRSCLPTRCGSATRAVVRNSITAAATSWGTCWQRPVGRAGSGPARTRRAVSRPKRTHGLDASNDIATGVGGIGFSDVGERLGIAENVDGLFELSQILRADQHRGSTTLACHDDALMLALCPVDDFTEVVAKPYATTPYPWPQLWRVQGSPSREPLVERRTRGCHRCFNRPAPWGTDVEQG
jgi:hypothetical protein